MHDPHDLLVRIFGRGNPDAMVEAPGRVNIIGEHTDYNDGLVLPFATQMTTGVALRRSSMPVARVVSEAFGGPVELALPVDVPRQDESEWHDYVAGLLWSFRDHLPAEGGFDVAITSTVPDARGMSSSAALEIAMAIGLQQVLDLRLDDVELVRLCQRAEVDYVGINSGVMDQFASLMARAGSALLLDVRAMDHRFVSADLPDVEWVVIDSGVRRGLAASGYDGRRDECREALSMIQTLPGFGFVHSLRDIGISDLPSIELGLPSVLFNRVRHVVEENERVRRTVGALRARDAVAVGRLLTESHVSLRDLYQVSVPETDFLVDAAHRWGAAGARIMGGGFGGVTLHLVPSEDLERFTNRVTAGYVREFGLKASVSTVVPSAGARQRVEEMGR